MEHYQVGTHVVKVSNAQGRWAVVVDERALTRWFTNRADAWTAGVQEVDRIESVPGTQGQDPMKRTG